MNLLCLNIYQFDCETLIYDRLITSIFLIVASDEYTLNVHKFNYETLVYDDVISLIFFILIGCLV